jgi:hypothetical protein
LPITKALAYGLFLAVHATLLGWATWGLLEWFFPALPLPQLANPLFPAWLLLFHWLAILAAGALFVFGFTLRWSLTPLAVTLAYAAMATVCAIETFGFLQHATRFRDMAFEYATYVILATLLFNVPAFKRRFSGTSRPAASQGA